MVKWKGAGAPGFDADHGLGADPTSRGSGNGSAPEPGARAADRTPSADAVDRAGAADVAAAKGSLADRAIRLAIVRWCKRSYPAAIRALAARFNRAEAEDILQDALESAWQERARFDMARGTFGAWMALFLRHAAGNRHRGSRAVKPRIGEGVAGSEAPVDLDALSDDSAERVTGMVDSRADLERLLAVLDPADRAILMLRVDGATFAQIAEQYGTTEPAARQRFSRAVKRLRRQAADDDTVA